MTAPKEMLDLDAIRERCKEVGSTTSQSQRDRRDLLAEVERLRALSEPAREPVQPPQTEGVGR